MIDIFLNEIILLNLNMISHTEENYLKALFALNQNSEGASIKALSKHLNIKMPTVNSMMKRLAEKGFVIYESYKPIRLTDLGKKKSALIIRKHRLAEMYLFEKMGFGWDEVHAIAEQLEHIQSEKFFQKMDFLLGFPETDPHGSPIPTVEGEMPEMDHKKLSDCGVGERLVLTAVSDSSEEFLQFLTDKSLGIGTEMQVLFIEKFDGSMTILVDDQEKTFSKVVSEKILVS